MDQPLSLKPDRLFLETHTVIVGIYMYTCCKLDIAIFYKNNAANNVWFICCIVVRKKITEML